jgi:hypothetical protein
LSGSGFYFPNEKKPKGRLIPFDHFMFLDVYARLSSNPHGNDVNSFKICCLQEKGVLYDSPNFQVGVTMEYRLNDLNPKNPPHLRAELHFYNKSDRVISDLKVEHNELPGTHKFSISFLKFNNRGIHKS